MTFAAPSPRPTPLPGDFAGSLTAPMPVAERAGFLTEMCDSVRPQLCDVESCWIVEHVRLRFAAAKRQEHRQS